MGIIYSGREYASKESAQVMVWKKANRSKWYASRDRANKKWPGKRQVRAAVYTAVKAGRLAPASMLRCFDCKGFAKMYDHIKTYRWEDRFCIQAVCRICSVKRDQVRGRRR